VSDDKYVDELSQAAQRAGNIVTEHIDSIADANRADQIRVSCRFRGLFHLPGSDGQSPPRVSIASAINALGE